jgi:hypothetical protein
LSDDIPFIQEWALGAGPQKPREKRLDFSGFSLDRNRQNVSFAES